MDVIKLSERIGRITGTVVGRAVDFFADPNREKQPQFVEFPMPGDALIAQGTRLNVMTKMMSGDVKPGYHITADVTEDQKKKALRQLSNAHAKWQRRAKNGDTNSDLAENLVKARTNMRSTRT